LPPAAAWFAVITLAAVDLHFASSIRRGRGRGFADRRGLGRRSGGGSLLAGALRLGRRFLGRLLASRCCARQVRRRRFAACGCFRGCSGLLAGALGLRRGFLGRSFRSRTFSGRFAGNRRFRFGRRGSLPAGALRLGGRFLGSSGLGLGYRCDRLGSLGSVDGFANGLVAGLGAFAFLVLATFTAVAATAPATTPSATLYSKLRRSKTSFLAR